ncbi:helix-turn-helix domain-containing protein [Solibacillus merdavium]|uniref:Helix-turn-helix domain-containing protein n=1 Tax=Solibacillus merdavium TaxID=2762218 RepID=A0ABR8XRN0_9BACL|nr:helix-turn-helix domain-containing protein [Solibacillus merdavium]MBD8034602.1 helix-turn-helix domain-containing protein [Solibacillus merdavium]
MELNALEIQSSTQAIVLNTLAELLEEIVSNNKNEPKEWMSIEEACKYLNISYNTFNKFRIMGLKVAEVDRVKRVAKSEIDRFLRENSF